MTPKYLSLEIRFCVRSVPKEGGQAGIESYEIEQQAIDQVLFLRMNDMKAERFVGIYARVYEPGFCDPGHGLLRHIGDWTELDGARDMLDVLTGTTEAERAAAGNPLLYVPPAVKPIPQAEGITALCIWEAMLDLTSYVQPGSFGAPKHQVLDECFQNLGSYEMRRKALDITPMCEAVWLALSVEDRDTVIHDWEFVPAFLAVTDWTGDEPTFPYPTPAEMGRAVMARIEATKRKAEG